jgi:divalent metal cation (Fe/Co/Zn/Cd) transporter
VAGYEAVHRLIEPQDVNHLGALAAAGALGFVGNWIAAQIRTGAGRRLASPALIADGDHTS